MERAISKFVYVILASMVLALLFNFLFFGKMIGISVFIFATLIVAALLLLGSEQQVQLKKSYWLIASSLFFALMVSFRASDFLTFLNVCAALGLMILLAHQLTGIPALLMRLKDYVLMPFLPIKMLISGASTLWSLGQVHSASKDKEIWIRVIKGVVLALPILIIFGVLFSNADLAFSKFLNDIIAIEISERTAQYIALLAFSFGLSLSYLSYVIFPKDRKPLSNDESTVSPKNPGRSIEVMVALGLVAALFAVFIGFQVTYLFGGESNIAGAGFTYAEYARNGFFELVAVAALSLAVLLAAEKYAGSGSKKNPRFVIPAMILIVEVAAIIVSALKRMSLYTDAYGMTVQRFYVASFIMLLVALFALLALKFLKAKPERFFTSGALLSVIAFLAILNLVNPDAYVMNSNIKRFDQTGKVDASYAKELSADAEKGKIELYGKIEGADKATLRDIMLADKVRMTELTRDWQSANLSRSKALKQLNGIQ